MDFSLAIFRWLHVVAGITWIGLLYYFNLVQMAALKDAAADGTAAGISKHVAPRALLWFRWAAVVTWLMGAAILGPNFVDAFTLQSGWAPIGVGACAGVCATGKVTIRILSSPERHFCYRAHQQLSCSP